MKTCFTFLNAASEKEADINIHDVVGFWGTNAKDFHNQLKAVKAPILNIHINSPGGNVVDGFAIYNMLRAHPAKKVVHIDGMAASIASVIAMAGDTIKMPENALMFIHQPWIGVAGNAEDLRKNAGDLDKISDNIKSIYEARTGSDRAKITSLMDDETLLTAKEAKELGFADEILPEQKAAALFDNSDYFTGQTLKRIQQLQAAKTIPPVTPTGGQREQPIESPMTKEEQDALNAANSRATSLEAEVNRLKTAEASSKTQAHQEGVTAGKTAETARKNGINALATKYNKNGDLNAITIEALNGDSTVEQFQAKVMDVINERPAKPAIKPAVTEGSGDQPSDSQNAFLVKYKACKTSKERLKLALDNKAEARAAVRAGLISE